MIKITRGFTLIELLVVIAIIGILSSVVLSSLNEARGKGANAAVKSNLTSIRSQTEIIFNSTGSYAAVCADPTIRNAVLAAQAAGGGITSSFILSSSGTTTAATCHSAAIGWAIEAPLKIPEGLNIMWCIDNRGLAVGTKNTTLLSSDIRCN